MLRDLLLQMRKGVFCAILLLFASLSTLVPPQVFRPGEVPEVTTGTVRVMSYNILYGTSRSPGVPWEVRGKRVAELVRQFNPDIFGVQEALSFQIDDLLSALPAYATLGEGRRGLIQDEHMNIFYRRDRFRVLRCDTFWLSETPEKTGSQSWGSSLPRIVTWAVLFDKQADKAFLYCNTHFDHPATAQTVRLNSAVVIWKFVKERFPELPVVVTGDLNCSPSEEAMQFLTGKLSPEGLTADFTDTYANLGGVEPTADNGITTFHGYAGTPPARRIDYVLVRKGIKPLRAGILIKKIEDAYPSDHHPVWTELRFE